MLRPIGLVVFLLGTTLGLAPGTAWAWAERPAPVNPDGSSKFSDPDENLQRLSGRSENGEATGSRSFGSSQGGGSGWSFSITQEPSSSTSPFGSMFNSPGFSSQGWPDRRR